MSARASSEIFLLYDGLCGFCNGTVRFILARDPGGSMRFAALQSPFARELISRHPELRGVDSLVLIGKSAAGDEVVAVRSNAVLEIAAYLGGGWKAALALRVLPRPLRDWAYDRFARMRYRLFGRYDACPAPTAETRVRFLA